jgi:chromosome segregation ATPase
MSSVASIEGALSYLEQVVDSFGHERINWSDVWSVIKGINFKDTYFESHADRQRLWERKEELVAEIRTLQERDFANRKHFADGSAHHLARIKSIADEAQPERSSFNEVLLNIATGGGWWLVSSTVEDLLGQIADEKDRLHARRDILNRAGHYLSEHKGEMRGADKREAFEYIKIIESSLNRDWDEWNRARQRAWEERNQARAEKQHAWEEKQRRWREGQRAFVDKLEGSADYYRGKLDKHRDNLENLLERYERSGASKRAQIEEWIEETRQAIDDIEAKVSDIMAKVQEVRDKLEESDNR